MTTIETRLAGSRAATTVRLDLVATGAALMATLAGLFVLCELAALVWPTAGLAHGWVRLFASDPANVWRTFIEGVLGSIAGAGVATLLFVPVYNRIVRR
ncbi:MAG: hypothetical protein U1E62_21985 [Alsobacter sp.]